jgi:uncharacterized cupin superfamily protein
MGEARIEQTDTGDVPSSAGWFVVNVRQARWRAREGRGAVCSFEGDGEAEFEQYGFNLFALGPGEPMAMYHWEADQEDFLVLRGEAILVVDGEERPLEQWDFVHTPANVPHTIIGAGDGPALVLAVGARINTRGENWGGYPLDETARRHGASSESETTDPKEAYARFAPSEATRYRDGWLP